MPRDTAKPVSVSEAKALFADLSLLPALVVAVSGGPDSTALLYLLARWRASLKNGPKLIACTVDHGLRKESAREAKAAGAVARKLKVAHRILPWRGKKPANGIQEAARQARYRLLADAAKGAKARHIVTAHTLDDQAETVLIRLARGSGMTGLAAMARLSQFPIDAEKELVLVRPLLSLQKSRLVATVKREGLAFSEDLSNSNSRFARVRVRALAPILEKEGLSAQRLSLLASRIRRADNAIDAMVEAAALRLAKRLDPPRTGIAFDLQAFFSLPEEVGLRLLGRTVGAVGNEGPVELGKLETMMQAVAAGDTRRTLAGALVTARKGHLSVERAPHRRAAFRP